MDTQTELKGLQIDRSARREREPKPVLRLFVISTVVALAAIGAVIGYRALNAATVVQVQQVQSPMSVSSAGEQVILTATGYIIAAHKIEVASKVNGRVGWIGVDKGDKVKAGQPLVRLEDDEYRAQLTQQQGQLANLQAKLAELQNGSRPEEVQKARADVNQAKADQSNSKVTLDRTNQLVSQGVLAKQTLDDAQAKYDGNEAKVLSLQRTLDLSVLGPRKEEIDQVHGQILQAADVGHVAARLYREDETGRRRLDPVLDRRALLQPVEGRVDLDRVEDLGVALQPAPLRQALGVEAAAPVAVAPAGATDPDPLHGTQVPGRPALSPDRRSGGLDRRSFGRCLLA